ncbi:hypothetical protein [Zymobacter palmae]|uniref:hypothetical protein n=1 Tax=Zymobacter palmae TaxID=33074 RepID=UPI0011AE397E|nr:hypothetical protein [Zymobacter palmae]
MTNTAPYGRPEAARASMKADFDFIIDRIIGKHRTVTLVQVVAVRDENSSGETDADHHGQSALYRYTHG